MCLQRNIVLLLLFLLSSFLPLSSFAYSAVDQMNKQGESTRVVRKYVGQWKGWVHHDHLINKAAKKKVLSPKKNRSANSNYSKLIKDAAKKLKIDQWKIKKRKLIKPRVLITASAKLLKQKTVIAVSDSSKSITTDSLRHFAKLLNIGGSKKKTFRKKSSRKLVVSKSRKPKYIKTKISKSVLKTSKNRIVIKNSESSSEQKNWSTVSQSLPLLMKALSD